MIGWNSFIYFAAAAVVFWAAGALSAWKGASKVSLAASSAGMLTLCTFIAGLWSSSGIPPLRTMGETRLWYSLFLCLAGLIVYSRHGYRWIPTFSTVMAAVFIFINIFKPQIHTQPLMPALQSPWFAPHVIVYMFCYGLLGAATIMGLYLIWAESRKPEEELRQIISASDSLVRAGLAFMTFGMLFGALWAKQAWGHYWTWDPKETWAAATWMIYLGYLHLRLSRPEKRKAAVWILLAAFLSLQMCWWGINFLPSAAGSVHTY